MKRFKYMALAALVAFAACDEGTDAVVDVPVTGDIAGVVTIEGAAVSGVTVALSSGATTTTDGSGAYSFSGVAAGAYTITISGFAADATFSSTSKAATIVTTGQVATVNFDGAFVRTSAILGSVAAGGNGLAGVSVSIGESTTQTDANGQYSFSGLRAGTYTVTVTGFNASQYAFATSTQNITLGVGESKVVSFNGQLLATSTIGGTLYIDANTNYTMDAGEPPVAKAGITVALERAVGDSIYTTTDANGMYSFPDLEEGTYKVILLPQPEFPGAFTQEGDVRYLAVATSGATTTVNFPFVITTQYVQVYGMLGRDAKNVGVAPIKNWTINLFPTDVDAAASTNAVAGTTPAPKTDANGLATFKFLRKNDYSPNKLVVDGIVFAKVAAPGAGYTVDGETVIEIPWNNMDSLVMAPDTFDAVFNNLVVKIHGQEIDSDTLPNWSVQFKTGKDTTGAPSVFVSNSDGDAYFSYAGLPANYPDTIWARLAPAAVQAGDNGHGWGQTPTPGAGTAHGSYLRLIWDGTVFGTDTVNVGMERVKYTDSDVMVQVHREWDDTMGYTLGDGLGLGANGVDVQLYKVTSTKTTMAGVGANPATAATGVGFVTFTNVPVVNNYELRARPLSANYAVLLDTAFAITFDGSDQVYTDNRLGGSGGNMSSFMVKTTNNSLNGAVRSRYGTSPVLGAIVTATPTAMNIQGIAKVDTTIAGGAYTLSGMREGPYEITVSVGDSAYSFLRTLKTTPVPAWSTIISGSAKNDSPTAGTRDLQGFAATSTTNFEAYRNDTKFSGIIVNDRDTDLTTIDPGEALAGAIINLYRDDDGAGIGTDTLIAIDTTDANGAYGFTGLVEGRYTAKWASGTPNTAVNVLSALTNANVATTQATATTTMSFNVANTSPALPAWEYQTSTVSNQLQANFSFLYANTVVQGTAKTVANAPVANMTVTLQRCYTSTANTGGANTLTNVSGPQPDDGANTTCSSFFGGQTNALTDASGQFIFSGLSEGVYKVIPVPGSVVGFTTYTPAGGAANQPGLYLTVGSGDIETLAFTIS